MIGAIRPVAFGDEAKLLASFNSVDDLGYVSGNFSITVPDQTKYFIIRLWGAGGGGAGSAITTNSDGDIDFNPGSGGGGGQHVETKLVPVSIQGGDVLKFTIGDGGFGGGLNGGGQNGEDTTVDNISRTTGGVTTLIETYGFGAKGGRGANPNTGAFPVTAVGGGKGVGDGVGSINNVAGNNGGFPASYPSGNNGGQGGTAGLIPSGTFLSAGNGSGANNLVNASDGGFPGQGGGGGHGATFFTTSSQGGDGCDGYIEVEAYG